MGSPTAKAFPDFSSRQLERQLFNERYAWGPNNKIRRRSVPLNRYFLILAASESHPGAAVTDWDASSW
jgi:hypothetical protein